MDSLFVTSKTSKKINIDGTDDLFNRYKMPQLQIRTHGKNKMVRTEFVNLTEVSNALHIDPKYIVAFMGYTTGTKFSVYGDISTYYISGNKQCDELSDKLQLLIRSMILCKKCLLPEVILSIDKKLWLSCKSCGVKYTVQFIEKFETFVMKNFKPQKSDIEVSSDLDDGYDIPIPKEVIWASDLSEIEVQKRKNVLCPDHIKRILD